MAQRDNPPIDWSQEEPDPRTRPYGSGYGDVPAYGYPHEQDRLHREISDTPHRGYPDDDPPGSNLDWTVYRQGGK